MALFTHQTVADLAARTQAQGVTLPEDVRAYEALTVHRGADPEVTRAVSQRWERDRAPTPGEALRPLAMLGAAVFVGVLAARRAAGESVTAVWEELAAASGGTDIVPDWDLCERLTRPSGRRQFARQAQAVVRS